MNETMMTSTVIDRVQPFAVRTSCGHVVERHMRPSTAAGLPTVDGVIDAPHGRECPSCEAATTARLDAERAAQLVVLEAKWSACSGHERDVDAGTLLCRHCGKSLRLEIEAARAADRAAEKASTRRARARGR